MSEVWVGSPHGDKSLASISKVKATSRLGAHFTPIASIIVWLINEHVAVNDTIKMIGTQDYEFSHKGVAAAIRVIEPRQVKKGVAG